METYVEGRFYFPKDGSKLINVTTLLSSNDFAVDSYLKILDDDSISILQKLFNDKIYVEYLTNSNFKIKNDHVYFEGIYGSAGSYFLIIILRLLSTISDKIVAKYSHDEDPPSGVNWPIEFTCKKNIIKSNGQLVTDECYFPNENVIKNNSPRYGGWGPILEKKDHDVLLEIENNFLNNSSLSILDHIKAFNKISDALISFNNTYKTGVVTEVIVHYTKVLN